MLSPGILTMRYEMILEGISFFMSLLYLIGCDEQSRYHEDYKEYNLDAAEKTRQEMLKLRNDLRSTHYLLGTDESSKLFNSTAKQSFMQPVNPQVSQLSLETKKDLRSHHFNLGNTYINTPFILFPLPSIYLFTFLNS